jgi:membrane protease YdiL (CAAX protease family)
LKTVWEEQRCKPKYYAIALLMQIGLFSLSWLNGLFLQFLEKYGYGGAEVRIPSLDGVGFLGVLVVVALLPAVFEEIFFRGFLLNGIKSAFGETVSVLLCGAFFALYHQNPAQTLYQFCCGVAFAFVAIRSGSILPTVLAHFFNNAFIITLEKFPATWVNTVAFTVVSVLCLLGAIIWLFSCKRGETDKDKKGKKDFFLYALTGIVVCIVSWISVLLG